MIRSIVAEMSFMLRWRYLRATFFFWFGLIWASAGTIVAIVAAAMYLDGRRFAEDGIVASAIIAEKGHGNEADGDSRYWLRYVYDDASGVEHVEIADVRWEAWRKFADGDSIEIQYLRDNSARSRIVDHEIDAARTIGPIVGLIGVTFGGIGWFLSGRAFIRSGQRARLIQRGHVASGTVTAINVNSNVRINGRHPLYLSYGFTDDGGTSRIGRSIDLPRTMHDRWNVGDPILVVHDPLDPSRHDVDVFDLRRDDPQMLQRG